MFRKIALNLLALVFGCFVALILLEVALRIYNPVQQTVKGERVVLNPNRAEVQRNTYLGLSWGAYIPGVERESHIHNNSLGFRGPNLPPDFAKRLTVITVGGSTTRSTWQSDDRTWTAVLGDAMSACFDRTWINNAGFGGHTSFAHLQLIEDHITKLHPRVVLLLIGANEFYVDVFGDPENRGQVTADSLLKASGTSFSIKGLILSLATRSETVNLALTFYRSYKAWKLGVTRARLFDVTENFTKHLPTAREKQPAYAERLRKIIRALRNAQIIPVLMTQPTIGGSGRDPQTGEDLSTLWSGQTYFQIFEMYNDTMRSTAKAEEVYLIDLARIMPKSTEYFWDPMHYTDAGARVVAELANKELVPYLAQKFPSFVRHDCHPGRVDKIN